MTHEELIGKINHIFTKCLTIAKKKNTDYAGSGDALDNFRYFGLYGVVVRLCDKFNRLRNIVKKEVPAVSNETIYDTLEDIINYAAIAIIMKEEEE